MHIKAGITQRRLATLFKIKSQPWIGDIITKWAVFLEKVMFKVMTNPTKSSILRNYPANIIAKFGHARIAAMVDCTDQELQIPKFRKALKATYSSYHSQSGVKAAVQCTPIGAVPATWITECYPSSISDVSIVDVEDLLARTLRFGDMNEADKGFLIDNLCVKLGIQLMRPNVMQNHQAQNSAADAGKIHKIGNTRITIEQVRAEPQEHCRVHVTRSSASNHLHLLKHCLTAAGEPARQDGQSVLAWGGAHLVDHPDLSPHEDMLLHGQFQGPVHPGPACWVIRRPPLPGSAALGWEGRPLCPHV